MYYVGMANNGVDIRLDRIIKLMESQHLDGKELAKASGVSEATISKLLNEKIGGTSATNLARIAIALGASVDFLLGLTDEPMPKSLTKEALIIELVQLAQNLTNRRRRDLVDAARVYLESSAQMRGNPKRLAEDLVDYITEAGGETSRDQLINYLSADDWGDSGSTLTSDDSDGPLDDKE